jgi:hypothetical protein
MDTVTQKVFTKAFKPTGSLSYVGVPSSPGSKSGLELNAAVTSRKWRPSPKPEAGHTVSIIDGIFRFDGTGAFGGDSTTWGTAKYIELFTNADNDEYLKDRVVRCFINLVEYDFVVMTKSAPPVPEETEEDGTAWLEEDGTPVKQEGL